MGKAFFIKALWDKESSVFVSESDIKGLHIEADTLEEFEEVMGKIALELVIANHLTAADFAEKSMREIVPAILWQRPENSLAYA